MPPAQDPATGAVRPSLTGQALDPDEVDDDESRADSDVSQQELPDVDPQTGPTRARTEALQEIPLRN